MVRLALPFLLFVALPAVWCRPAWAESMCSGEASHIAVDLRTRRLALCQSGEAVEFFHIRLGHSGVGKTRAGDGKTPIGVYPLGRPRLSKRYGVFIPIGYPTGEQRKRGFTGGSIGVHGPDRREKQSGNSAGTFDTTRGCVGLAEDEEMDRIVKWLRATKARMIELR